MACVGNLEDNEWEALDQAYNEIKCAGFHLQKVMLASDSSG